MTTAKAPKSGDDVVTMMMVVVMVMAMVMEMDMVMVLAKVMVVLVVVIVVVFWHGVYMLGAVVVVVARDDDYYGDGNGYGEVGDGHYDGDGCFGTTARRASVTAGERRSFQRRQKRSLARGR